MSGGVELGTYYVSVTTSTKKLAQQLSSGSASAGDKAGALAGSAYTKSFNQKLATGLKIGAAALTGAVAFKGIDRLLQIDQAQVKLKGLGLTTQGVAEVMNAALLSVQGTAFGLGDAATQASSAFAAGITGSDLEPYLATIADVAARTGSSLGDIGLVFNQITSAQRLYTQDANQLVARGIPVYQLLAKQYGVTGAALRKMVEQGKVDSKTFFEVIQANVGGAAVAAGDTIQGSFANLSTALARVGANVLAGGTEKLPEFFKSVTESLQPIEGQAKVIGSALGGVAQVIGGLPGPVLATAVAVTALNFAMRSNTGQKFATGIGSAATNLRTFTTTAAQSRVFVTALDGSITATSGRMLAFSTLARTAGSSLLGAFGGPVGLGVTVAIGAITAALSSWQAATEAQQQAVADLTTTLDQNTGAVTAASRKTIFDQLNTGDLKGTIDSVEALGIKSKDFIDVISTGGPGLDAMQSRLTKIRDAGNAVSIALGKQGRAASDSEAATLTAGFNAQKALDGLNGETRTLGTSQEEVAKQTRAGIAATDDSADAAKAAGAAAKKAAPAFKNFGDAVASAFKKSTNTGAVTDALSDLAKGLAESKVGFNDLTSDGVANTAALQDAVAALAHKAGGDNQKFVASVSGLLQGLQNSGVDVTNVMGVVQKAVNAVTGGDYHVYLNGDQFVAEAKRLVKALAIVQKAASSAVDPEDRAKLTGAAADIRTQLNALDSLGGVAKSTASSYGNYATAAKTAAAATSKSSSGTDKATAAQKRFAKALKESITSESFLVDGIAEGGKAINAEYNGFIATIRRDFKQKKITKAERDNLIGNAKDWKQSAIDARDAVTSVLSNVSSWLKPSLLSSGAQSLIDSLTGALDAKGISKGVYDQLVAAVTAGDAQLSSIASQREVLATKIDDATSALQDAISIRDDFKKSIIDGFKSLGDITKFAQSTDETVTTYERVAGRLISTTSTRKKSGSAASLISGLQDQVAQARKFKAAYATLAGEGLNGTSLQNLIAQFLSTGDASVAESLAAGGLSAVGQVNDLTAQLGNLGGDLGQSASSSLFQAGVDSAQGFLDGLKSQDGVLAAAYDAIANNLVASVKKKLGIASPSKVMAKLAKFTSQGWNDNLNFTAAAPQVVAPAQAPFGSTGAGSGEAAFHLYDQDGILLGTMRGQAANVYADANVYVGAAS